MCDANKDFNGIPILITIPVYYDVDDEGNIRYDEESMWAVAFEKLAGFPKKGKKKLW